MIKRVTPLPKGRCVSESNSLVIIRTLRESFSNLCIKDKDKSSMSCELIFEIHRNLEYCNSHECS